ncbi:MAG: hypothetical protein JXA44_11025 [Methanospirillaceae archaeon]|nr:hypothetical protein [Methanospirillaceae archaeon]
MIEYSRNRIGHETTIPHTIQVDNEVISFINERKTDFRISTSCGGPVLLPLSYKASKPSDIAIRAGDYTIYISMYQARYIDHISLHLIPFQINQFNDW